ncbi:hypothetical protein [Microbacterium sp. NPDC076895]|uniref:hypothetical protein n=1 Tax=Microbacterium sp. NPDC076895 TaxID=3154957 RepID=UPI00342B83BD
MSSIGTTNPGEQEPSSQGNREMGVRPTRILDFADDHIARLASQAPSRQAARRLRTGLQEYSTPFALYLELDDVDPYADTLLDDFEVNFRGYYPSRRELMDETLEVLGLRQELDDFFDSHEEFTGLLTFDYQTLWELLQDRFEMVEIAGGLYVFER